MVSLSVSLVPAFLGITFAFGLQRAVPDVANSFALVGSLVSLVMVGFWERGRH